MYDTKNIQSTINMLEDIFGRLNWVEDDAFGMGIKGTSVNPIDGSINEIVPVEMAQHACKDKEFMEFNDLIEDIDNVIFNDPATIVTFKDGSKVCVKACKNDTFSKETGLIYAIVKRLYANDIDDNGYLKARGLGEKINKIIVGAYDQKKADAAKRAKLRAKAKAKETKENLANEVPEKSEPESCEQKKG